MAKIVKELPVEQAIRTSATRIHNKLLPQTIPNTLTREDRE